MTFDLLERIRFRGNPMANPESVVTCGKARFTVLASRLIRLEWSETGEFEDRGTYAFPTRFSEKPAFTSLEEGDTLIIRTAYLELRYRPDGRFTAENLSISFEFSGQSRQWTPGTPELENLRGTCRTLDMCERETALGEGLLSRAGWTLFDDSRSVMFNQEDGWVAPRPDHELQDWYFAAYGHDYKAALAEYTRFGGSIPLIPRYVLGAWWSRFWAYSDQDLKDLVEDFAAHDLPLDVLVVDMDWHTPHSWTGYTWNRELFPDPEGFLRWVHARGLRATFNLHPAEGVQSFEEVYPRFAEAMGVDPASGEAIPFRITDKKFVRYYFELLHHPMEEQGVDFWWLDWQQGESTEMKGVDPLPWINHLHFHDSTRRGKRGMIYSRWGGLGNHRYPIGFSGDTFVGWGALQFQPYFTATAGNVLFGWWSHDIGGHMGGATEPELYARWVQYGALSPCLRLHSTKDERCERRPWIYPPEVFEAAKAAFHWRYRLVPYIYTMARQASDTGLSLCRPMYYEYPEEEQAYAARYQYFFGDQMIAAPVVFPADPATGLAAQDVWLPEGTWIDYSSKETFTGPGWVRLLADLERAPMLVKEAAILPLAPPFIPQPAPRLASGTTDALPQDRLVLSVFPGKAGRFRLYEDDGVTPAYQEDEFEWTEITTRMDSPDRWEVRIAPVEGRCAALPERRAYQLRFEGSRRPQSVQVDGAENGSWEYDPEDLVTIVHLPERDKRRPVVVTLNGSGGLSALGEGRNQELLRADLQRLLGDRYPVGQEDAEALARVVLREDFPGRADAVARLGGPFVRVMEFVAPEDAARQFGQVIAGAPHGLVEPYDLEVDFSLHRPAAGEPEHFHVQFSGLTGAKLVSAPFAYDGQAQATRWEAKTKLRWRGETFTSTFQSSPLFPTIHTWHAIFYNPLREPVPLEQALDPAGRRNPALNWQLYAQSSTAMRNLSQPFGLWLFQECSQQLLLGEPMAGYLATTITSPQARQAALLFMGAGEMTFYLNGQRLADPLDAADLGISPAAPFPTLSKLRALAGMQLQEGENTLVLHTTSSPDKPSEWFFGGALASPAGELLTDVTFQ